MDPRIPRFLVPPRRMPRPPRISRLAAALQDYELATDAVLMIGALIPDTPVRPSAPVAYPEEIQRIASAIRQGSAPNKDELRSAVLAALTTDRATGDAAMVSALRLAMTARRIYVLWEEANEILSQHPHSDEYLLAMDYSQRVLLPHRETWMRVVSVVHQRAHGR